jgi:hypothetical protein
MRKILVLILLLTVSASCNQQKNYLILAEDADFRQGYLNQNGDTVIPFGKYEMCFTDTIKTFGIVLDKTSNFVAIDKNENVLFEVFKYDNGPDYFSEGLIRIVKNGKIGYANEQGKIVIKPQYDCAWPFANGKASVSNNCKVAKEGEHLVWTSENWIKIDKSGNIVK